MRCTNLFQMIKLKKASKCRLIFLRVSNLILAILTKMRSKKKKLI